MISAKPHPKFPRRVTERLPKRKQMTIAIGSPFQYEGMKCALVCADSRIVWSDGATAWGSKLHLSIGFEEGKPTSCSTIANATEDADAALMLANDLTRAIGGQSGAKNLGEVEVVIKQEMTAWHLAYGQVTPPAKAFVLAVGIGGACGLFFCAPPNTVMQKWGPFAIGSGSRAVNHLFPETTSTLPSAEAAVLRAAYWIYRAKRDEGSACGGEMNIAMVSERGTFGIVDRDPGVKQADALGKEVDGLLQRCRYGLLSWDTPEVQASFLSQFSKDYLALAETAHGILFPGMEWLKGIDKIKAKKSMQSGSRKLGGQQ